MKKNAAGFSIVFLMMLAVSGSTRAVDKPSEIGEALSDGAWNRVKALTQTWLRQEPGNPIAHFALAASYYFTKEYERQDKEQVKAFASESSRREVLEWCEGLVRAKPGNKYAVFMLGAVLHASGALEKSVAAYRNVLKLDPRLAEAYSNLGTVYNDTVQYDDAIAVLSRAIEIDPRFAAAYVNLGYTYSKKGMFTDAEKQYEVALGIRPNYPKALYNAAVIWNRQGSYDRAISSLRKAIQLDPLLLEAYQHLAYTYQRKGAAADALATLRKLMDLDPMNPAAAYHLGSI
jgi:tetratricopeptide (TPR) repeat protein